MGLLDQVVGALAGQQGSAANPWLEIIGQLINNPQTGGLGGLLDNFRQGGLGHLVDSWISTGQNLPISGEQLQAVLGSDLLGTLAKQLGTSSAEASGSLAQLLPGLIDQLTPQGELPQGGDLLTQGFDLLKKGGLFS